MVAVLLAGRWLWPHWTVVPVATRAWHLTVLVLAGTAAYVSGLFAAGLRLRDLRAG
jgi:putative peptidoglycan lipid II flippase